MIKLDKYNNITSQTKILIIIYYDTMTSDN